MEPKEYEVLLHDAEIKLARLKALYEQYFQGIEKLEPSVPRKDLDRLMDTLRRAQPRNTALRFRLQMLIAKYGTYQTYWQRIARQIEEGTYRRDVVRAQQRRMRDRAAAQRQNEGPSGWELEVDIELQEAELQKNAVDFDDSDVDAILGSLGAGSRPPEPTTAMRRVLTPFALAAPRTTPAPTQPPPNSASPPASAPTGRPITTFAKPAVATFAKPGGARPPANAQTGSVATPPPAPRAETPPRPPPPLAARLAASPARGPSSDLDEARMRRIYESYIEARKRNNERVDNVKFETVQQSVQQMMPKLREKHGDRPIDFEVVVQNGKVGLKPKVRG